MQTRSRPLSLAGFVDSQSFEHDQPEKEHDEGEIDCDQQKCCPLVRGERGKTKKYGKRNGGGHKRADGGSDADVKSG